MRVAVVGLGRIGLPTAVLCAMRGHDVVGIDHDHALLDQIARGELPYDEPGLADGLDEIVTSPSLEHVAADVWIIAVGTTLLGELDATSVFELVAAIAPTRPRLIAIESTVSPGTSAAIAAQYDVPIAHCPERARPGCVFEDVATSPRLIGGVDDTATRRALEFYATLTDAPLLACRAAEAELAKLAENAEREVRIAFANEVDDVAARLDLDAVRVIALANSHPRTDILRPGIGVGGRCLPMATRWFATHADGVTAAARSLHDRRPAEVAARITRGLPPGARICVLGRTYRPDTRYECAASDPYGSPAAALIAGLEARGFDVVSWDPSDEHHTREQAEAGADLVFVAVGHAAIVRKPDSGDTPG